MAGTVALSAQQVQPLPPAETATFELTSVKRNISGSERTSTRGQPNGGWSATNVRLRAIIARAYEIREFQITGGPDWVDFDRFDIAAKGPEGDANRAAIRDAAQDGGPVQARDACRNAGTACLSTCACTSRRTTRSAAEALDVAMRRPDDAAA